MKSSSLAKGLFVAAILYTLLIYIFADPIAEYSKVTDPLIGLVLYFITQPLFVLTIIVSMMYSQGVHKNAWRGLVGGTLLAFWGDFISLPHCVSATGLPTDSILYACSDTLVIKMIMSVGIPFGVAYTFYYLIFVMILLIAGFLILGNIGFTEFFGGGKLRRR